MFNSALSFPSVAHRQTAQLHIDSLGPSPRDPQEHGAACICGGRGRGEEHGGDVANDDRMARRGASAAALAAVVTHTDEQGDESGGGGGACADARLPIASQEAGRVLAEELVSTHP